MHVTAYASLRASSRTSSSLGEETMLSRSSMPLNEIEHPLELGKRRRGQALRSCSVGERRALGIDDLRYTRDLYACERTEAVVGLEHGEAHVFVLFERAELEPTLRENPNRTVAPRILKRRAAHEVTDSAGERRYCAQRGTSQPRHVARLPACAPSQFLCSSNARPPCRIPRQSWGFSSQSSPMPTGASAPIYIASDSSPFRATQHMNRDICPLHPSRSTCSE